MRIYTCACVWIFLYTYIYIDWIHKYLYINEYIGVICICMYTYRHIHIHICIIIYVHMSVYFCTVQLLSCVQLFATPWTAARPLDYSSAITGWNIAICDNLDRSWDYQFKWSTSEKDKYCMISHLYGTKNTKLINT